MVLEVQAGAIRKEKRSNMRPDWGEGRKNYLYPTDDMLLYMEIPKESTRKLLELLNEFSKVSGYKINMQKLFISL